MFKKAASVSFKGETKLRGKEAKKLQAAVAAQFGGEANSSALLPGKADVVVKKAGGGSTVAFLFVDGACALIQPDGRSDVGDAELVPALSALWKVGAEALLPCILIQRPVAKFVFKGANVMAPGIHSILAPKDGAPVVGALVAVRCVGNPHACAVGRLRMSMDALSGPLRVKGEAVEVLHYFGDALWEACGSPRPAGFVGDTVQATDADEEARLAGGAAGCADEEGSSGDESGSGQGEDANEGQGEGGDDGESAAPVADSSGKEANGGDEAEAGSEDPTAITPQAMNRAMEECFLQAAKTRIKNKDLPLTGNVIYSQHMRPCRRAGTNIDVKSSTYKKLGAFMSHLEEQGWLALKKHSAEPIVTKVEFDHPDLREWQPWPRGSTAEAAEAAGEGGSGSGASSASARITVEAVFRINKCADLVGALGAGDAPASDDGVWTREDLAQALKSYVDSRKLWMQNNRKRLRPDDLLLGLISSKDLNLGENSGLPLDGLVDRVLSGLPACHRVTAPQGGAVGGVKVSVRPGKPPTVQVKTDTRRGHHVTLAYGLEAYGVEMEAFAALLQKALACSATVESQPQVAVMVQGFWDVAVVDWLTKVGIPEDSIQHQVKKGQQQKKVKQATNVVRA